MRLQLQIDVHARGKLDAHESLNNLLGGLLDLDQTLVGALLELFTAVLVLVYRTENGDDFLLGRQRYGTGYLRAVSLCDIDYLFSRLIDERMFVASESHSDFFACCHFVASLQISYEMEFEAMNTHSGVSGSSQRNAVFLYPAKLCFAAFPSVFAKK